MNLAMKYVLKDDNNMKKSFFITLDSIDYIDGKIVFKSVNDEISFDETDFSEDVTAEDLKHIYENIISLIEKSMLMNDNKFAVFDMNRYMNDYLEQRNQMKTFHSDSAIE